MLKGLYKTFQKWSDGGSIWLLSDFHFDDEDCKLMNPNWIEPYEQILRINKCVGRQDTLICLGDVGDPRYVNKLRGYKVLITGNHDKGTSVYEPYFDEVYNGPLFISDKILLSHEPVKLPFICNIHGHEHNGVAFSECDMGGHKCMLYNVAADVVDYSPVNLKTIINSGNLSKIDSIHRLAIDKQRSRSIKRDGIALDNNKNIEGPHVAFV